MSINLILKSPAQPNDTGLQFLPAKVNATIEEGTNAGIYFDSYTRQEASTGNIALILIINVYLKARGWRLIVSMIHFTIIACIFPLISLHRFAVQHAARLSGARHPLRHARHPHWHGVRGGQAAAGRECGAHVPADRPVRAVRAVELRPDAVAQRRPENGRGGILSDRGGTGIRFDRIFDYD